MLENTKEIKPYSRYQTAVKLLGQHPAFIQVKPESQREVYFAEYVQGLQRREKERLRELRKSSMDSFSELLRNIPEITFETRWKEAQALYTARPEFQDPRAFEGMDLTDFLTVYEKHSHMLWEKPLREQAQRAAERRRAERKAREGFRVRLQVLILAFGLLLLTICKGTVERITPAKEDQCPHNVERNISSYKG